MARNGKATCVTPTTAAKREVQKRYRLKRRQDVLVAYGGKCACCGEAQNEFLSIDHIDGGGREHRRQIGTGANVLYHWLRKNDYPEGFRVLCHNCNAARGFYGYCPHQPTGE